MFTLVIGGSASGKSDYAERHVLSLDGTGPRIYMATMEPFGEEAQARIARHHAMRRGRGFETIERYRALGNVNIPPGANVLLEDLGNLTANELFGGGDAREELGKAADDAALGGSSPESAGIIKADAVLGGSSCSEGAGKSIMVAAFGGGSSRKSAGIIKADAVLGGSSCSEGAGKSIALAAPGGGSSREAARMALPERMASEIDSLLARCTHLTIVTNEVFSGGKAYEGETLTYLRILAKLNILLARRADRVVEVVCGLPVVLK